MTIMTQIPSAAQSRNPDTPAGFTHTIHPCSQTGYRPMHLAVTNFSAFHDVDGEANFAYVRIRDRVDTDYHCQWHWHQGQVHLDTMTTMLAGIGPMLVHPSQAVMAAIVRALSAKAGAEVAV